MVPINVTAAPTTISVLMTLIVRRMWNYGYIKHLLICINMGVHVFRIGEGNVYAMVDYKINIRFYYVTSQIMFRAS